MPIGNDHIRSYVVKHWMYDSDIALQCSDENCVCRRDQKNPDRDASEPDSTNELVVDAGT